MWKKRSLVMESRMELPQHVVDLILERLGVKNVKSLLRFRAVSKQWKSTIDSPFFQDRLLKQRQQSGDPDVLMVSVCSNTDPPEIESLRTLVLGSSSSVKIPTPWDKDNTQYLVCFNSCDGLVCLYDYGDKSGFVVNPTTRWYRPLPLSHYQQLMIDLGASYFDLGHPLFRLGFGKDICTDTYKPVWLYNSSEISLENETTCEVFDFTTNVWRYVTPASPCRIAGCANPVFVDGSLHWFTDCEETKVVSFDLHTEAFQVICKAPFSPNPDRREDPHKIVMCNLDNRLCVSELQWPNQLIWAFNSGNKTWEKICSIDLDLTSMLYDCPTICAFHPLALLDTKKKKKTVLFYDLVTKETLLTHDPETKGAYPVSVFMAHSTGFPVCYHQSLFSIK